MKMQSASKDNISKAIKKMLGFLFYNDFDKSLPKHLGKAELQFKKNVEKFYQVFRKKAILELNEQEINILSEPDAQFALRQAFIEIGRKDSETLRQELSNLLIGRIKNDGSELKRILFDEAIPTIGKLTTNQLQIITACFVLQYTLPTKIATMKDLNSFLEIGVKPFLFLKGTDAEFMHIEYSGCGSLNIGTSSLVRRLRDDHSILFMQGVEKSIIDKFDLPEKIKNEIMSYDGLANRYVFTIQNLNQFRRFLISTPIHEEKKKEIIKTYKQHIYSDDVIEEKLRIETRLGTSLVRYYNETLLKNLTLTSVGILIAATHLQNVTGIRVEIDAWIS